MYKQSFRVSPALAKHLSSSNENDEFRVLY